MERYKLKQVLMTEKDLKVLVSSLRQTAQDEHIPEEDRTRAHELCERLCEQFKFEE